MVHPGLMAALILTVCTVGVASAVITAKRLPPRSAEPAPMRAVASTDAHDATFRSIDRLEDYAAALSDHNRDLIYLAAKLSDRLTLISDRLSLIEAERDQLAAEKARAGWAKVKVTVAAPKPIADHPPPRIADYPPPLK